MWTEMIENPQALEMFDSGPLLDSVTLSKLFLDREGPTVTMAIQIRDYPKNPPPKWQRQQHNAVTMDLQAMGVEQIKLLGWTTENQVSISIGRLPEGNLQIRVYGGPVDIELRCGWLRVVGVTPYFRAA